ncbi:MAG TPA: ABC transporter permease, partial [Microvirga sp.]|nr:ABC transporter permease [Microvirga sp.]
MVNTTQPTADLPPAPVIKQIQDERLKEVSLLTKIMRRPELGALAGLVLVTIFFLSTADSSMFTLAGVMNILSPASQL